jgi:hypothetical protein
VFPNVSLDFEQIPESMQENISSTYNSIQKEELQNFVSRNKVKELKEFQDMTTTSDRMLDQRDSLKRKNKFRRPSMIARLLNVKSNE